MTVPFKVKAVYEYKSDEADDLNFPDGQIITVTEEEDEGWYTGEYTTASGQKLEGIFPGNFVEKYEPAIPSRPNRASRKSIQPEPSPEPPVEFEPEPVPPPQAVKQTSSVPTEATDATEAPAPVQRQSSISSNPSNESKPATTKSPPSVAEKPTSNSFKDRIAAFNKPAAAPITPFKPPGGPGSSGFIKKPFVAPPPSRNAYVPLPSQAPPPQTAYRREEDPEMKQDEDEDNSTRAAARPIDVATEDQPKPTSLKDRIALLQQQQLEQAARSAEKKKPPPPKKPPTKRTESADTLNDAVTESTDAPISRRTTGESLSRPSAEAQRIEEEDSADALDTTKAESVLTNPVSPPSRELVSDTNDADDSEAGDTEDARDLSGDEEAVQPKLARSAPQKPAEAAEEDGDAQEQEDTEDEDPEIRRRRELRDRMAKMSGGMGMMGMFGGGMPAPSKKPQANKGVERSTEEDTQEAMTRAPPVPIMALPGMSVPRPEEPVSDGDDDRDEDEDDDETAAPTPMEHKQKTTTNDYISQPTRSSIDRGPPTSPPERALPAPPREVRAPPPIPGAVLPPRSQPAEVDQEAEQQEPASAPVVPPRASLDRRSSKTQVTSSVPPPPPARPSVDEPRGETRSNATTDKRLSRPPPPPVPSTGPSSPTGRAPPPPVPTQPPTRSTTSASLGSAAAEIPDDDSEEEVTEYEGDYDTDIASSAKYKDALKSHNRESSIDDEDTLTDDARLPMSPPSRAIPPPPPTGPPRDLPPPPPPPSAPVSASRASSDLPRGAPPPVPTSRPDDEEYDPYRYSSSQAASTAPPVPSRQSTERSLATQDAEGADIYAAHTQPPATRMPPPPPPVASNVPPGSHQRTPSYPPPAERSAPLPPLPTEAPRASLDVNKMANVRRSAEIPRSGADYGFMAADVDLAESSGWWTHENALPPSLQTRNDILYEIESNSTSKRGGRTTVTKDIYVLWMDYSQTTINVSFDPSDPSNASFQQSHERPPPPPRPDQLESASEQFGAQIFGGAQSMLGNTVADGTPHAFVQELIRPHQSLALLPIGVRAYGALVYANLANASTQQFDQIRPGDIVTFRNAKFAGHKGGLHAKYSMDVGKPDHAAVVIDWDGTKKKIRALEQGREEKGKKPKVKEESFRIGDLKSGEIRVWRIMPRSWVNWEKS